MSTRSPSATESTAESTAVLERRAEAVGRARHDLGKYVALSARCLEPGASAPELRAALAADLNATRSSPRAACGELWAELRPGLVAADVDPAEIAALDGMMGSLGAGATHLDTLPLAALQELARTAIAVGDRLRAMHRRALAESGA